MKKTSQNRKWFAITACILFIGLAFLPAVQSDFSNDSIIVKSTGNTIYVDDDGGADFTNIQDAINASSDGDTVFVYSGTYYENIIINKSINLKGEIRDTTIIDGKNTSNVAVIESDYVTFEGFIFRNSSHNYSHPGALWSAIRVLSSNNSILNCIIENTITGIHLLNSTSDNLINNCSLFNTSIIVFESSRNRITNNTAIVTKDYDGFGSAYVFSIYGRENVVINNNIYSSVKTGLKIQNGNNIIQNNTINSEDYYGISTSADNNIIKDNNILSKEVGIYLAGDWSNGSQISDNTIVTETNTSIKLYKTQDNKIYNNKLTGGIVIYAEYQRQYAHNITNNTINGKNIYYLKNKKNFTVPNNAAQLIVYNCLNVTIENIIIEKYPFYIISSSEIKITNCTISNCNGILFYHTCNSIIEKNNIYNNEKGICLEASSFNLIKSNNIENNEVGIDITIDWYGAINFKRNSTSKGNIFEKNNIIKNSRQVKDWEWARSIIFFPKRNRWKNNYWGRLRLLPKPIIVSLQLGHLTSKFGIFYINLDLNPAKRPYDIT